MSVICNDPCAFLEKKGGYENGFCSCFRSPLTCIATFFCPCIVVGRIAGEMDDREFSCIPCLCGVLGEYRLRRNNNDAFAQAESEDSSMLASTICHCCAYAPMLPREHMHDHSANTQCDPGRPPVAGAQERGQGCRGRRARCRRRARGGPGAEQQVCCGAERKGLCDVCEDGRQQKVSVFHFACSIKALFAQFLFFFL